MKTSHLDVLACGFAPADLAELVEQAKGNLRLRQHRNIHGSYRDPCQRLLNAIELSSYIRPHRHAGTVHEETLLAVCGAFALAVFDDHGAVTELVQFASEKFGGRSTWPVGVRIQPQVWHTVVALEERSILFEVKTGPFDPDAAKVPADWAPAELSTEGAILVENIRQLALRGGL